MATLGILHQLEPPKHSKQDRDNYKELHNLQLVFRGSSSVSEVNGPPDDVA